MNSLPSIKTYDTYCHWSLHWKVWRRSEKGIKGYHMTFPNLHTHNIKSQRSTELETLYNETTSNSYSAKITHEIICHHTHIYLQLQCTPKIKYSTYFTCRSLHTMRNLEFGRDSRLKIQLILHVEWRLKNENYSYPSPSLLTQESKASSTSISNPRPTKHCPHTPTWTPSSSFHQIGCYHCYQQRCWRRHWQLGHRNWSERFWTTSQARQSVKSRLETLNRQEWISLLTPGLLAAAALIWSAWAWSIWVGLVILDDWSFSVWMWEVLIWVWNRLIEVLTVVSGFQKMKRELKTVLYSSLNTCGS